MPYFYCTFSIVAYSVRCCNVLCRLVLEALGYTTPYGCVIHYSIEVCVHRFHSNCTTTQLINNRVFMLLGTAGLYMKKNREKLDPSNLYWHISIVIFILPRAKFSLEETDEKGDRIYAKFDLHTCISRREIYTDSSTVQLSTALDTPRNTRNIKYSPLPKHFVFGVE